jgi:hypothetical protein
MNQRKLIPRPASQKISKDNLDSDAISLASETDPQGMPDGLYADELSLARLYLSKALQERDNAREPKEKLAWDYSSRTWLEMVLKIKRHNLERRQGVTEGWESFLEAIRMANETQSVKR